MDERFGSWIRDALADVDEEILRRRWSAVEVLVKSLEHSDIMALVSFCAIGRVRQADTLSKVKREFWNHDNAFNMEANGLELRRLCAAIVMHSLSVSEHKMDFALATSCLYFAGLAPEFALPAMATEAEKALQALSKQIRPASPVAGTTRRAISPAKVLESFKESVAGNQWAQAVGKLEDVLGEYAKAVNMLATQVSRQKSALEIEKEEIDVLWWLVSDFSNDLEKSFKKFKKPVVAIVAGKELADHIQHRPGPLGAASILDRVISSGTGKLKEASLNECVLSVPSSWKRQLVEKTDAGALDYCPVLAALSLTVDVDDDESWTKAFAKRFPHSTDEKVPIQALGFQMYREWMLAVEMGTW